METENKIITAGILLLTVIFLLTESNLSPLRIIGMAGEGDFDGDGIPDSQDEYPFDYDNDGMPDIWEKRNGLRYDANDAHKDYDKDGIKNIDEYKGGTDPLVFDITEKAPEVRVDQPEDIEPYAPPANAFRIWVWVFGFIGLILFIAVFVYLRSGKGIHIFRRARPMLRRPMPSQYYQRQQAQRAYQERLRQQAIARQRAMEDYRRRMQQYQQQMQQYQQYYQQRR